MMMLMLMQADKHQENLVIAQAKKLEADGLVNFITINEVRYITEYNQVVGPTQVLISVVIICFWSFISWSFTCYIKRYFIEDNVKCKIPC